MSRFSRSVTFPPTHDQLADDQQETRLKKLRMTLVTRS